MLLCALAVGMYHMIAIDLDHRFKPVIRQYLVILLAVVEFYWLHQWQMGKWSYDLHGIPAK